MTTAESDRPPSLAEVYVAGLRSGGAGIGIEGASQLSEAIRRLLRVATGSTCPQELLADAAVAVNEVADRLEHGQRPSRYPEGGLPGDFEAVFRTHPIVGPANGIAPPGQAEVVDGRLTMRVTYGPSYEGPMHCVHGGQIAAAFDAVLAITAGANGIGGMTRHLTVHYRKPTPLNTELVYEGWVDSADDRNTYVRGVLRHGEVVCAEVEGALARPRPR